MSNAEIEALSEAISQEIEKLRKPQKARLDLTCGVFADGYVTACDEITAAITAVINNDKTQ